MKIGRTLTISFGEYDEDVKQFLSEQKNASGFIRHLVRAYMNGENIKMDTKNQVEKEVSFTKTDEKRNKSALQELDL